MLMPPSGLMWLKRLPGEKIKTIVDKDGKVYIFTSAERRIDVESFASVTGRGKGTPLISD